MNNVEFANENEWSPLSIKHNNIVIKYPICKYNDSYSDLLLKN
jgi:hypothetical protein